MPIRAAEDGKTRRRSRRGRPAPDGTPTAGGCAPSVYGEPSRVTPRSEEHTSELSSLMRISYAVFCLKKQNYMLHTSTLPTFGSTTGDVAHHAATITRLKYVPKCDHLTYT